MGTLGADAQGLGVQRAALRASTTGHTVQVPVDTYFSTYQSNILPSALESEDLISWVQDGLKQSKPLNTKSWPTTKIRRQVTEDDTYRGLEPIAEEIHGLCLAWNKEKNATKVPKRTTRLICRPRHETASEVRGGSMKTDARFILMESRDGDGRVDDKKVKTCDVGGPMEAKLHLEDRGTNEDQIVGAVSHILYNDPSRRFVLAFTVEANMMRFWYFSRSHIAVTAEFDYHANPRDFIRFISFMMFSPLERLGYDPTVVQVRDENNQVQYQFTVGNKKYQTVRCIDETSALDIVTRATRVWAVRELDANDQPFGETKVLKDVWLYIDAKSEQTIQKEIFAALEELDKIGVSPEERPPTSLAGATMADDAKQYFMTIVEDVPVWINGQIDTTATIPDGAVEFCYTPLPLQTAVEGGRGYTQDNVPAPPVAGAKKSPAYPHTQRKHRRIVFAEECQSLYTVDNYGDFTLGLAQLVYGLDYMRLAGFIHRDISPGNCLLYMEDRHIKISDLEYARRYNSQCQSALPLTGTPGFMAVEYQALKHHFLEGSGAPGKKYSVRDPDEDDTEAEQQEWFQFNFLHDLESVLWILLSHLLTTVPDCLHAGIEGIAERHTAVLKLYNDLFDGSLTGSAERRDFIWDIKEKRMTGFLKAKRVLAAFYDKANASALAKVMNGFKYLVRSCYMEVEATDPYVAAGETSPRWDPVHFKHEFYRELHSLFMDMHHAMDRVEYRAGKELKKAPDEQGHPPPAGAHENNEKVPQENNEEVTPNPEPGPSQPRKRRAEDTIDEEPAKRSKSGTRAGTSRSGKRRAEDDVEPETTKKAKSTPVPTDEPPIRSLRTKSGGSSGAAKGRKSPARKTKQAAASSSRQPSGAGSSAAAGTCGQSAAGPSRPPRAKRVVESSDRKLRSAKKDET